MPLPNTHFQISQTKTKTWKWAQKPIEWELIAGEREKQKKKNTRSEEIERTATTKPTLNWQDGNKTLNNKPKHMANHIRCACVAFITRSSGFWIHGIDYEIVLILANKQTNANHIHWLLLFPFFFFLSAAALTSFFSSSFLILFYVANELQRNFSRSWFIDENYWTRKLENCVSEAFNSQRSIT